MSKWYCLRQVYIWCFTVRVPVASGNHWSGVCCGTRIIIYTSGEFIKHHHLLPENAFEMHTPNVETFVKRSLPLMICLLTLLKHCLVKFRHPTTVYTHFFLKKILNYTLGNSDTSYILPQCRLNKYKSSFINWCLFNLWQCYALFRPVVLCLHARLLYEF